MASPEEAFDCPAGSGAMLAFLPTRVICDSVLRAQNAGVLPMEPFPTEAVVGGSRGAGGGIAPLVLGLADRLASLCRLAAAALAIFRAIYRRHETITSVHNLTTKPY